jgi:hypothetical protein
MKDLFLEPSEANHRANRIQCHIYMSIGEVKPMLREANHRANRIQCYVYMSIGEVKPMLRRASSRVGV